MNSALFILGGETKAKINDFCARERIRDLIKLVREPGRRRLILPIS